MKSFVDHPTEHSAELEKELSNLDWCRVSLDEMTSFEGLRRIFVDHGVVGYRGVSKKWFVTLTSFVSRGQRAHEGAFVHGRTVFHMSAELAKKAFLAAETAATVKSCA